MRGFLDDLRAAKDYDPEATMPDELVVGSEAARWLEPEVTGNPSRIGILLDVPAVTMAFCLQEIPGHEATDLQRHPHESVHCVLAGAGRSEIGPRTVEWGAGDFVYTPPWVWHRHYNTGADTVRMLLVENSPLVGRLGLAQRDSAGSIAYGELDRDGLRPGGGA